MMEGIRERVGREFLYFKLDMLRTSRENIFAHAHEINVKKQIFGDVCRQAEAGKIGRVDEERLAGVSSILDAVFCYHEGEGNGGKPGEAAGAFERWLAQLGGSQEKMQKNAGSE